MTYCEHCGEEIGYLPFKCKYCGGSFCQLHRLPENHDCSFEIKHPFRSDEPKLKSKGKILNSEKKPLNIRRYIKRQEKLISNTQKAHHWIKSINGPKALLFIILIATILASIFQLVQFEEYIYFNLTSLINNFTYYTILTSLFITEISLSSPYVIVDVFLLVIMLYLTYILSKSLNLRFGSGFLFKLYIISTLFSLVFFIFLRLTIVLIYPIPDPYYFFSIGFAWGGILGLLSYSLFPAMNREITALMTIIPIRMRARTLLYIIIIFRIIPILFNLISFVFYLPDLGGILGAYILYKRQLKNY